MSDEFKDKLYFNITSASGNIPNIVGYINLYYKFRSELLIIKKYYNIYGL